MFMVSWPGHSWTLHLIVWYTNYGPFKNCKLNWSLCVKYNFGFFTVRFCILKNMAWWRIIFRSGPCFWLFLYFLIPMQKLYLTQKWCCLNKFVRKKMHLKLGTKINLSERFVRFVRLICQICQFLFSSDSIPLF